MGRALPNKIYYEEVASRRGLHLACGPDPRSFDPLQGAMAAASRSAMGLDK